MRSGAPSTVARRLDGQAQHVVGVERHPLARRVDHALGHGRGALHGFRRPGERQRITARASRAPDCRASSARLASATPASISKVGALGGELPRVAIDGAGHRGRAVVTVTRLHADGEVQVVQVLGRHGGRGILEKSARAAVDFGKAMTSRSDDPPASSIAMRSNPKANAAVGRQRAGAQAVEQKAEAVFLLRLAADAEQREHAPARRGSVVRMDPPPSSMPL